MKHTKLNSEPIDENQYCFVIHSVHPYCYEFYQIFALPSGFHYRQRYDERWVENSVRLDLTAMVGKEVLILFWNLANTTLYPVRWGRITTAQKVGRIFYFEYALGDFVAYKADTGARSAQILAFNDTFNGFHRDIIEHTPAEIKTSVFKTDVGQHLPRTTFDDLTNWGSIVDVVAQADVFKGVEFLKVIDLLEGLKRNLKPVADGYQLRDGRTYRLRVFQIVPNPAATSSPHDIELNSFVDQIQILRKRQTAVGKYDVLTYLFKLSGVPPGEQTAFEIRPVASVGTAQTQLQTLYIPIYVAPPSTIQSFARLAGMMIGLGLIFIPLIFGLEKHPLSGYIGMIAFTLSLVGPDGIKKVFEPFLGNRSK